MWDQSDAHSKLLLRVSQGLGSIDEPMPFPTEVPARLKRLAGPFPVDLRHAGHTRGLGCLVPNPRPLRCTAQACHRGRNQGMVIEDVSLAQATSKDPRKDFNTKAAAWRALRRTVARGPYWQLGGMGEPTGHTFRRAVHTMASISLPDLGPWNKVWISPSQAALAYNCVRGGYQRELDGRGQAG